MRDSWISTFYEMEKHMQPEEIVGSPNIGRQLGFDDDQDEEVEQERTGKLYIARCINGFVRNRASRSAAANCQFQALTAFGAKLAGWKLVEAGYQDALVAFIHEH